MSPVAAERASAASAPGEEAPADPPADPEPAAAEPLGWAPAGACTAGEVDELEEPHPTATEEVATRMEQRRGPGSFMPAHAAPDHLNIS